MGKTLVPVLSCNLVEELYTSAGQLVKRGKPEKVNLLVSIPSFPCHFRLEVFVQFIGCLSGGPVACQERVSRDEAGDLLDHGQEVDQEGDAP